MGKAQSKRSVDITTETKKGTEDEITEKMGKIEDLDKKDVVNGDATISEKSEHEKKDVEVVENDKDLTTEKEVVDVQASGDSADPQNAVETSKDDAGSAAAEEDISPLADESIKKSKKEKVKKKWSFRSISFGKKDKLKPSKSEEAAEEALNGADDKTNESDDTKKDNKSANENEEKTRETHENGNATPQELNGEQNGEKKPTSDDKSTANMTNTTTTTETTSESVQNETAAVSSSELSEKTENTAVINNETKTSENATAVNDDASKNGNGGVDEKRSVSDQQQQEPQKSGDTNATTEAASDKTSHHLASAAINESSSATTNGEVVDQIHQNGDHGEPSDQQAAVIDKSKAQIEVNSNTDNNVSAATLDSLSSTSTIISPSNVQTHVQDLIKASSDEVPDEIVQINNDDPVNENSTATDKITIETIQTVDPSAVDNEIVAENLTQQQVTEVFDAPSSSLSPSKMVDNEILLPEKLGVDSPPPPPLPISPPPSQVSVFAFTNNEDAAVQTKDFEPAIHNLIEEEKTELQQLLLPSSSSSLLNATEIDNSQEIGSIGPIECAPVDETIIIPKEPIVQEDDINKINNVEIEKCQEMKVEENKETVVVEEDETNLCKDSVVSEETPQIDETAASVAFAATVIEEITETAAEIVNQHLKCDREQITDELSAPDNNNDDDVVMNNKENIIENYIEDKTQSDIVQDDRQDEDYIDLMCEDGQKSEQITNNKKTLEECSSDLTPSNLIHQNEEKEEEMNSLNKSNSLDEIHLDPTKEFGTAKDIKDNVTVAEITQDLSVTCE